MVATRQALPGNLPSIYVFILHSDDHNFFLLISRGSVCKNRRYSSSINISLYIFKNIKNYFKIILEIYIFLFLQLNMFLFLLYLSFLFQNQERRLARAFTLKEKKTLIFFQKNNFFFLILTPLKNFPNSTPAQNTNATWIFLFMLLVYKF